MSCSGTEFRVAFCISGNGYLFRAALRNRMRLGMVPALAIIEQNAAAELEPLCLEHRVKCVRVQSQGDSLRLEVTRLLEEEDYDLVVLTFNFLLPAEIVRKYQGRIINVHMSQLPAFRGFKALERAIAGGVGFAGVTIHEVTESIDGGAIIAQCLTGVRRGDSPAMLGARLYNLLQPMYLQTIRWHVEGRVEKEADGRIIVRDAVYGEYPFAPALETSFPD